MRLFCFLLLLLICCRADAARRRFNLPVRAIGMVARVLDIPQLHPFAAQGVIVYPTGAEFTAVNNAVRAECGLSALEHHDGLTALAQRYARLCRDKGFISHYHDGRPDDRVVAVPEFSCCTENLTGGPQMLDRDPFASWRYSPAHYQTILGNFSHCGFGVAYDANGFGYWVGIYAR